MLSILLVDDHRVFAEALTARLRVEPDVHVVGAVSGVAHARRILGQQHVDVLLLDVDLGADVDGITFARELRSGWPGTVLLVTCVEDPDRLADALAAGVAGWVAKDEPVTALLAAIRGAVRGETHVPPMLLTRALRILTARREREHDGEQVLRQLTPRERDVLQCMVGGLGRAQIAQHLVLSTNTVRTHTQSLLQKLGVHSSIAAVALARQFGVDTGGAASLDHRHPT